MIRFDQEMFEKLSFDDELVEEIELFSEEKILKVYMSGAYDGDKQLYLDDGLLVFKNWIKLTVLQYERQEDNIVVSETQPFEKPRQMDIFEEEGNQVVFGGYSPKVDRWVEWKIIGSSYYAEFDKYGGPPNSY